jgi:flavin-dependent dehydrogenase
VSPDLIVIGAGPAGLAAAIAAARYGVDTLVLERRRVPNDKACGEGVLPNGVDALARLGLSSDDLARVSASLKGIRYITRYGRIAASPFPGGSGLGIRRACLSDALAARATRESTLELRCGARAEVHWSPDGPTVAVGKTTWRPRLVIGADGLQSRVRLACHIETAQGRRRRWGVRQHFSGDGWTDHVEVYFGRGFEAYVTPVAGGVNVAWLWEQGFAESGPNVCQRFLAQLPLLAERLAGRLATDRPQSAGPFRHRPRARARDGVLLVGDAAGYLDPLTGEGVGLALAQAELFEQHVLPLLDDRSAHVVPASACAPYLRAVDAASKSNYDLTRLMLFLARRPAFVERIVGALAADPALFRHCLDANMGRRPLWPLPVSSMLRLPLALIG